MSVHFTDHPLREKIVKEAKKLGIEYKSDCQFAKLVFKEVPEVIGKFPAGKRKMKKLHIVNGTILSKPTFYVSHWGKRHYGVVKHDKDNEIYSIIEHSGDTLFDISVREINPYDEKNDWVDSDQVKKIKYRSDYKAIN